MLGKLAAITFLTALVILCGCGEQVQENGNEPAAAGKEEGAESKVEVPGKYRDIYQELEGKLEELDACISDHWDGEPHGTTFSVELLTANSNRGEALLCEDTFQAIRRTLDSLESLGVKGITLGINYPILNPDFPRSQEYLDFYRRVAGEIKGRRLALIIETTTTFRNPTFSSLGVNYSGLTLDRYMREKRAMAETVLRELKPDYLTVENEPATQRANTGLDFSAQNQTDIVSFILSGLDRSGVKIGAGAGTWEDLAYFESLARNTSLDYLDMHIYPIQGDFVVDKTVRISDIARSSGKGLSVGEAWLYKLAETELSVDIASAAGIFARDAYSFWIPLDGAFLEVMVKLSHYLDLEFASPFWMQYLYAYVGYDSSTAGLGYRETQGLVNQEAARNINSGTLSPTGETYRELITGGSSP